MYTTANPEKLKPRKFTEFSRFVFVVVVVVVLQIFSLLLFHKLGNPELEKQKVMMKNEVVKISLRQKQNAY